jgi:hypothetical protein
MENVLCAPTLYELPQAAIFDLDQVHGERSQPAAAPTSGNEEFA